MTRFSGARTALSGTIILTGFVGVLGALTLGLATQPVFPWMRLTTLDAYAMGAKPKTELMGEPKQVLSKEQIAQALKDQAAFYRFPSEVEVLREPVAEGKPAEKLQAILQYTFDQELQSSMEKLIASYRPDYGAFVAVDPKTGRVLSMVSYSHAGKLKDNLALRASFPSASVFKVVTAAAAIGESKFSADTQIAFNGRSHTLYKSQILKNNVNRWTRHMTLREAFAKSVNTVFGRIGAFNVGHTQLASYADRFAFNRKIASDVPIQPGRAPVPSDAWGLAETASGFTRDNTMSPLQGALIAAAIANDGLMMEPYMVQSAHAADGSLLYSAKARELSRAVDPAIASEIRELMRETVRKGTSRGSFKGFFRKKYQEAEVGGKTGSLTGTDPRGKYDWFVGYAQLNGRNIAYAALTIHEKLWRVKSTYLARRAIENYFSK